MSRQLLLLTLSLLHSSVGGLSQSCVDTCGSRAADDVSFRLCLVTCREASTTSQDIDENVDGGGYFATQMTGDFLRQLQRNADRSNSEIPEGFLNSGSSEGRSFGPGKTNRGSSWRNQGGGEDEEEERMPSVRIAPTPLDFLQIPSARLQNSAEDGDWPEDQDTENGFFPDSAKASRTLSDGRSLADGQWKSSFVPTGTSPLEKILLRQLGRIADADNDDDVGHSWNRAKRSSPTSTGREPEEEEEEEEEVESSSTGIGETPLDEEETSSRSSIGIARSSMEKSKRPSFVRIGKSQIADDKRQSFVRIGKTRLEKEEEEKKTNAFMSDDSSSFEEEKRPSFVRIGKSIIDDKRPSFVRIGKSLIDDKRPSFVRIGKSLIDDKRPSFVRIGKSLTDDKRPSFVRIGKSLIDDKRPSFVRIGKSILDEKRPSFVRIGKSILDEKRPSFVRIGKALIDDKRPSFVRIGKSIPDNKRPSFVRIGRSFPDSKRPSFVRIGKSLPEGKRPSFVRIGKSQFQDVGSGNDVIETSSSVAVGRSFDQNQVKRQSFVRIGKSMGTDGKTQQRQNPNRNMADNIPTRQHTQTTESSSGPTTLVPTRERWQYSSKYLDKYSPFKNDYRLSAHLDGSLPKVASN